MNKKNTLRKVQMASLVVHEPGQSSGAGEKWTAEGGC